MSNTASAGEDVLSFLETLDEMTAKPAATASSARRNASPAKRANLPLNPSGNAGGAQEVLSFLDEITTSTSAAPTLVPPATQIPIQPPTAQIQPPQIPTQSSPIANAPPSGAAAPPPSGFVPAPRTTAHPRSRHAPPPESALPVSHVPHVRTTSFVPDADPVHGNVLPAAPSPAIPEEREQQAQGQGQGQGWSWGSLISSTSKLIETAREQVGAGEKAIVERVKKMGIDVGGIREAVATAIDQIAPPPSSQPAVPLYLVPPSTSESTFLPDLVSFCFKETVSRMPIAREALGAAVELRVVEGVSCAPVEGVEMGAVQAENTLDSIIPRLPSQENALILIIQPLLLPLPHRNTTNPHTSYFLLLHRPASQGAAEVHAVSVTQSIPLIEAKGRMSGWLEEQKMRGLESGVYSLFESLGAGEREEGEPLDAFA